MQTPQPQPVENDDKIAEALKQATGEDTVKAKVGEHPDTGADLHTPGYRLHPAGLAGAGGKAVGMYAFVNSKGQVVQVPEHRVLEALPQAAKAKPKGE